jgi:FkbH-like protein
MKALRDVEPQLAAYPPVRVRVLRNYTLENLAPLLRLEGARSKLAVETTFADFDTFEQEVLDPQSVTNSEPHDLIVVSLWLDGLLGSPRAGAPDAAAIADRICSLLDTLEQRTTATIAVTSFVEPATALGGARRTDDDASILATVTAVNQRIAARVAGDIRIQLIDMQRLVARIGRAAATDLRFWYLYHSPLTNELLALLAEEIAASIAAAKGAAKKVLVLDCDNTLWGGIIGEDGMTGIALDPNEYPGSAFHDFQRQLLELKSRGVLLALCSKNNEADALAVFDEHEHSLLKREDFAAWRINWADKPANLRELADALNLGIDSFVFVDDNPVECEFMRTAVPDVTVLQVPERLYEITSMLRDFRGFDGLIASAEDRMRTAMYQQEARRDDARRTSTDLESYLRSLELVAEITRARPDDIARIAQLTQKTNQFNLTTRRYSAGDIERLAASPDAVVMSMRVRDRFGDYGLTAVGIVTIDGAVATIDSLLMSCRILGRHLEQVFVRHLVEAGFAHDGVTTVEAAFIPTKKNQQVADFYERVGFARAESGMPSDVPGTTRFHVETSAKLENDPDYITVVR